MDNEDLSFAISGPGICTAFMAERREAVETQTLRGTSWTAGEVRAAVATMYGKVATNPSGTFRFPVGPDLARKLGYPEELLQSLSPGATESFTGVACPVLDANLSPGEVVLDLGPGRAGS